MLVRPTAGLMLVMLVRPGGHNLAEGLERLGLLRVWELPIAFIRVNSASVSINVCYFGEGHLGGGGLGSDGPPREVLRFSPP
eukprot:896519-Pelagomonas_calceolata.AAC.9